MIDFWVIYSVFPTEEFTYFDTKRYTKSVLVKGSLLLSMKMSMLTR